MFLLYGANGYTGELIAREAVRLGLRPILAGRSRESFEPLARQLNCQWRAFPLDPDTPAETAKQLSGVAAVLNCAGPFALTARPLIEACLAAKVHYLDITGEIEVIEMAAELDDRALAARITVLPAVGFDVVPTDCLAAMLAEKLPDATHLQLAFAGLGGISRGTAKTMLRQLPQGGAARIDGKLQQVPVAWKSQKIPFHDKSRWAMTIPWGDVAGAFYSTGIPNIEVYYALPRKQILWLRRLRWLLPIMKVGFLRRLVERKINRGQPGPTEQQRNAGRTMLWGQVSNAAGQSVEMKLETLEGYALTVQTALASVQRIINGNVPAGFQTPSLAFGKEFVLEMPGTSIVE